MIVGITGTLGAGKGTVADFLVQQKGFNHYSVRDFLVEEINKRGLPINRDNMVMVGNDLRAKHGAGHVVLELYKRAQAENKSAVIESIRTVGEVETLRKLSNFELWAVDAPPRVRYDRIKLRGTVTDDQTFEQFIADEKREMTSTDPAKQNLGECIRLADHIFINNGSKEDLYSRIVACL
ncbi:MAG TPA: AAA family ATPase [Candidatus Paceibacterota bacterium]